MLNDFFFLFIYYKMFQNLENLQTWHIITIVIIVFAIIGTIAYYMRKTKKNSQENTLPQLMASAAVFSSGNNDTIVAKRDSSFYEKLGFALCDKPITNPEELYQKLKEKFPQGFLSEILIFYIFLSPKLTEQQKKDFIVGVDFENKLYQAQQNNSFENIPYLKGDIKSGQVVCNGSNFCKGKETVLIQEYADTAYEFLSTLLDSDKFADNMRTLKTTLVIHNQDGTKTEKEAPPLPEKELQKMIELHSQGIQALKTKIESTPFCSLY